VSRSLVQSLLERLDEVQQVFIRLLSDPKSKHLSRESCCLGLAACQGLTQASSTERNLASGQTNDELNQRLLRAFGQTTNYQGSAMMETTAQAAERRATEREAPSGSGSTLMETFGAESEVGGASGMGEAALGAYREMASASVSIGRADILYTLLMLSVSHLVWFSEGARERYGASSLLGQSSIVASRTNSLEMREALRPHIGKLLPRILRACHDPNKQTREQMLSLWVGLTGGGSESRLTVTQHLLPAVDILITDSASKLWRARVGACGALTEIIVGRDWGALGGGPPVLDDDDLYGATTASAGIRLLRLWRTAMRSLDDVRGAVRDSGEKLARAVRGLTVRLCDPSMLEKSSGAKRGREEQTKHERDATAAAATSLRWLIRHGLNQACSQAVGISISTLVEIVGVVRPQILGPILPDLLKSLLMAMSGLEPAALNYVQQRTDDQEGLERLRLQLAQSGPLATAVAKCLDLLPSVKIEIQKAVIPQLDTALRMSAGFATRAATADAVSTLCATCPDAFRFSGPSNANPTVRLLRAFYFASERERGQGAKDKMIHALGNLASHCPGSSVRSLAIRACERYNASTGNNHDAASRRAAASTLRAIAVRASNQFADGGNSDIWCRRVLPVAFIGRKDSDPKIAALWKEVWEEGGGAANASDAKGSFSSTLEETLLPHLVHECVKALKDVSWSRRAGGANALSDLCDQGILAPAPRSTKTSKVAAANASLARSRHRAQASRTALNECLRVLIKPRLWTGKSQVLKAVVKLASKWVSGSADGDVDEMALFGWDGEASTCPWKPLLVSPGQFGNDLFAGDNWFLDSSIEVESGDQAVEAAPDAMEVDEKDDSPIDFEECDKILGDDDQNDSTDDSPDDLSEVVTFTGLCRLLIVHALQSTPSMKISEEFLPYRAASFNGFRDLLNCLPAGGESVIQQMEIYGETSAKLLGIFKSSGLEASEKKEPPVLVASAINSLAACFWDGIGSGDTNIDNANALELATTLKELGGSKQPAWTVREASALCTAELATKCHRDVLRQANLVSTMVTGATHALKDRKFWKVR
jgi:proteasome component ECM29